MSRRRKHTKPPKTGPVFSMTSEEATLAKMPKYNAHACGTGAHGDRKYNRARENRRFKRDMDNY